jgi:transcriptional regulator with PAS, ATPase and Fis domain
MRADEESTRSVTPGDPTRSRRAPLCAHHCNFFSLSGLYVSVRCLRRVAREMAGAAIALNTEKIRHELIGGSTAIRELIRQIAKIAPSQATVLIEGESGTGKELVARALHRNSRRAEQPFVAVNCAALPEALLEAELFGHEKGAFTGAVAAKKGKFELASGGTLFLDEIGELPMAMQAKMLRALQERTIDRVGAARPTRVDIRVIAATNRNLESAVAARQFREDLYYRLMVVSVTTPPLRERNEDIPVLAQYFLHRFRDEENQQVRSISNEAESMLRRHDWPGNVRELEHVIQHAVIVTSTNEVLPEDLPRRLLNKVSLGGKNIAYGYYDAMHAFQRQLIDIALNKSNQDHKKAARLLGVHVSSIRRFISQLDLKSLP